MSEEMKSKLSENGADREWNKAAISLKYISSNG